MIGESSCDASLMQVVKKGRMCAIFFHPCVICSFCVCMCACVYVYARGVHMYIAHKPEGTQANQLIQYTKRARFCGMSVRLRTCREASMFALGAEAHGTGSPAYMQLTEVRSPLFCAICILYQHLLMQLDHLLTPNQVCHTPTHHASAAAVLRYPFF